MNLRILSWAILTLAMVSSVFGQSQMLTTDNINTLIRLNPNNVNSNIFIKGYATNTLTKGGVFYWKRGDTTVTNEENIFASINASAGTGRWNRITLNFLATPTFPTNGLVFWGTTNFSWITAGPNINISGGQITSSAGGGNVSNTNALSTANGLPKFTGTTGLLLEDSGIVIDATNNITGVGSITLTNAGLKLLDTDNTHSLILTLASDFTNNRAFNLTIGGTGSGTLVLSTGSATIGGVNTGDQVIALSGDVSGSGTGSIITTILPNTVTFAKMQQIGTNVLLGNTTAIGNIIQLNVGDGLAITNGYLYVTGIPAGSTNADVVGALSSTDNAIVRFDGATGKIIQNSVGLLDDSGNLTGINSVLLPNAGLQIKDTDASHYLRIIPGSDITTNRDFTIVTGDANKILNLNGTIGDTFYYDGTNYAALAKGTSGQFLQIGASIPLWANGTGTTLPAGADSFVQYNNGGVFGGVAGMTWNDSTHTLSVWNLNVATNLAGLGTILIATNRGEYTFLDTMVTSSSAGGTEESVIFSVDGNPAFKLYSQSNGAGGVTNAYLIGNGFGLTNLQITSAKFTVNSLSALQAINPSQSNLVAYIDGGASGIFYGTNTIAGTNHTAISPGTRSSSTTANWSWERLYSGNVMLGWWGAKNDGTITTNEVDAALNYMRTLRGGTLELWPLGKYRANWLITPDLSNVRIIGSSQNDRTETNSNVLVAADYTRPVFQLGDGTGFLDGFTLENVAIRAREGSSNAPAALYIYGGVLNTYIKQFGFIGGADTIDIKALGTNATSLIYFDGGNAWEGTNSTIRVTRPTGDNYVTGIYFDHFYLNGHNTSGFAAISDRGLINFDNFYADTMDGHGFATTNSGGYITTFNTTLESDSATGVLFTALDDSFKELTRYVQGGGKMIGKIRYADASTEDIPQIQGVFREPLIFSPQITSPFYISGAGNQFSKHNVFDEVTTGGPLRYTSTNGYPFIFQTSAMFTNATAGDVHVHYGSAYTQHDYYSGTNNGDNYVGLVDFPNIGSGSGVVRFFRGTEGSGARVVQIMSGNGSANINYEWSAKGNSAMNLLDGNMGVGKNPVNGKLDVAGTIAFDKLLSTEFDFLTTTNGQTITIPSLTNYSALKIGGATLNITLPASPSTGTSEWVLDVTNIVNNIITLSSSVLDLRQFTTPTITNVIGTSGLLKFKWSTAHNRWLLKQETIVGGGPSSGTSGNIQLSNGSGGFTSDADFDYDFINDFLNLKQLQVSQMFQLSGTVYDSIAANQNNYLIPGTPAFSVAKITADAARDITGIMTSGGSANTNHGLIINVANNGSSAITLKAENASSSPTNRFAFTSDVILAQNESATIIYDSNLLRWRLISASVATSSGSSTNFGGNILPIVRDGTTASSTTGVDGNINSYTVSANTVSVDNGKLTFYATGTFSQNGSAIQIRFQGQTLIVAADGSIYDEWTAFGEIFRVSSTVWKASCTMLLKLAAGTVSGHYTELTEYGSADWTAAQQFAIYADNDADSFSSQLTASVDYVLPAGSVDAASISDEAYNATTWNGITGVAPSKNSVRDKIELLAPIASPTFTGTATIPTLAANVATQGSLLVTNVLTLSDGTVSAPSVRFANDNNTGLYSPAPDYIDVAINGVGNNRITTSLSVMSSNGQFGWTSGDINQAPDTLIYRQAAGVVGMPGLTTTGVASKATDTAVSIATTGWTNTFGKNAVVMLEGVGVTYTIYNNAGTAVYTNVATVVNASIPLQVSGKVIVTAGTGVSGTAFPW